MGRPKGSKNVVRVRFPVTCKTCGNIFEIHPYRLNDAKFCCHHCYALDLKLRPSLNLGRKASDETRKRISLGGMGKHDGAKNPRWKGGRFVHCCGYILIKNTKHPFKDLNGYVFEHRLVMEKHLGRYLDEIEVVHHINEDKTDNRIENLVLFTRNGDHMKHHFRLRKRDALGRLMKNA